MEVFLPHIWVKAPIAEGEPSQPSPRMGIRSPERGSARRRKGGPGSSSIPKSVLMRAAGNDRVGRFSGKAEWWISATLKNPWGRSTRPAKGRLNRIVPAFQQTAC